ncbi:RNA polymerase subunit RPABC3 [Acrasis kona]|uniref:DNA-directed RNA polymerases I, II, and III subunit RPABC3 n=1 Tax=Acrasis kona TaxID=1008807 RepID=A0AAW2ZAC1_9EUKA
MSREGGVIFEDIFEVKNVDPDGRKFDKVSRMICDSEGYEMELVLDFNNDVLNVEISDKLTIALATTLDKGGMLMEGYYDPFLGTDDKPSLLDDYDYVMHGRVYKFKPQKNDKRAVYVSFGGLLMRLIGDPRNMQHIDPDTNLYLLISKVQ